MRNVALGLAVLLFILGVYVSHKYQKQTAEPQNQEVLSIKEEQKESTPTPITSVETFSIQSETVTPHPTKSSSPQIGNFIYPNSKVITQSATELKMESYEDTDKITNWYKGKIEGLGMNVKSFVTTRANDKVLNKLSAADGAREINVEISKDNGGAPVEILLNLKNF